MVSSCVYATQHRRRRKPTFSVLAIGLFLELGLVPVDQVMYVGDEATMLYDCSSGTYAELGVTLHTESLMLWTLMESRQVKIDSGAPHPSYAPYRMDYALGANFYFSRWLLFGAEHECVHAVLSSSEPMWPFVLSETRVYVRFGTQVNRR